MSVDDAKKKACDKITFKIRECTRGSKNKEYSYEGQRTVLPEPMKVKIKGNEGDDAKFITYRYSNKVMKVKTEKPEKADKQEDKLADKPEKPKKASKGKKADAPAAAE